MGSSAPKDWAADKRRKLQRYATDANARWTRESRDVCLVGVPCAALDGCGANGGDNENTTSWISFSERERAEAIAKGRKPLGGDPTKGYGNVNSTDLNELGRFGVEGNRLPELVATGSCPWIAGARSDAVRKILGRAGVEGGDWYGAAAIPDQIAIGVWNLRRHLDAIRAKIDPRLSWADDAKPITSWAYSLAMMSWSAGSGGASKHVNAYADELAALPESKWWGAFMRCAGREDSGKLKHREDGYTALRAAQAVEGAVLALTLGSDEPDALAWLRDDGLTDDERAAIYARLVEVAQ